MTRARHAVAADADAVPATPLALIKRLRGSGFTVLDATRHEPVGHVGAGRQPHGLAVHPAGRYGYVPYMGSNTVEVLDLATLTVAAEADRFGVGPVGATLSRAGDYLFVSCYGPLPDADAPGLAVFETAADGAGLAAVAEVALGKAGGLAVDARGDVWVALPEAGAVVRLAGSPPFEERQRVDVADEPRTVALAPETGLLAVNDVGAGAVTFVDALAGEVRGRVPAPNPRGGTAVPAADRWFVGDTGGDGLTAIDLAPDGEPAATPVSLGTATAFTDATPDGALLAVDAYDDDRVTFLDPATLEVVDRVAVGPTPRHPRFSPGGDVCYVPSVDGDCVTVLATGAARRGAGPVERLATIDVPDGPAGCFRTDRRRCP